MTVPEHFAATADLLELYAGKVRRGAHPESVGREVELLGKIMQRKT